MLKHYCTIAWRHLVKNRRFTLLNLLGLSAGLSFALLIFLWVDDELHVDTFHQNNNRLFQVMENLSYEGGIRTSFETPASLAESLDSTMPEVEYAAVSTSPTWFRRTAVTAGEKNSRGATLFVSKDYLKVFSYPLLIGNKDQVLTDNSHVLLSESLARTLFQTVENSMGKTITWQIDQFKRQAVVAGVFKNTPVHSSVQFDVLLPFDVFSDMMQLPPGIIGPGPFITSLVLKKGTDTAQFNHKLLRFVRDRSNNPQRDMFIVPYAANYLHGQYENGVSQGGRITYVKLFSLIAVFIVLMACINFMNLSTAEASGRVKEVGVRKTVGARRSALVLQYLGESVLLCLMALVIAVLLVVILLPQFNAITGKHLGISAVNLRMAGYFLAITLLTGCLAGSYPAFYLSGFNAVAVLKGKWQPGSGGMWVRKGLVVFQFVLSAVFVIGVLVVYRQLAYMQHRQLGYDKEQVIYFDAEGRVPGNMDAFLNGIKNIPGVVNASSMVGNVIAAPSVNITWNNKGKNEVLLCRPFQLYYDMIETLGIHMAAGRSFSRAYSNDASRIIFNEAAIRAMGMENPLGKVIDFGGTKREIIGIVKDFHFQSLHEAVKPLFFLLDTGGTVMVKMSAGAERQVLQRLEAFYKTYNPGFSFEYTFLSEDYRLQYQAERQIAALSKYFSALAVLIACLGLFGLAAYTAEKRSKEISIRKVLGASSGNIAVMLSKEFIRAVLVAVSIAVPLAWYIMHNWLNGFAYHIPLQADVFLLAGGFMLLVTLVTVSSRAMKAAWMNPVNSLKTE
jgi:ABC-type lipoprotein release transport system permease subunit